MLSIIFSWQPSFNRTNKIVLYDVQWQQLLSLCLYKTTSLASRSSKVVTAVYNYFVFLGGGGDFLVGGGNI